MLGRMISAPGITENLRDVKSNTLVIELTEKGRLEAANWKEADEPLSQSVIKDPQQSEQVLPWWIIPIGDREILRIEKVEPGRSGPNLEVAMITFRWRWRPNKLGESFDLSNVAFSALPAKAREAVTSLNMSSQYESVAIASLNKRDGSWECVDITFPSELIKN